MWGVKYISAVGCPCIRVGFTTDIEAIKWIRSSQAQQGALVNIRNGYVFEGMILWHTKEG